LAAALSAACPPGSLAIVNTEGGPVSFWDRYAARPPQRTTLDEIVENLQVTLNARRGFSSARPDFGIESFFSRHGTRDMLLVLRDEILDEVKKEEPRLREPELELLGTDNKSELHLELRALVEGKKRRLRIRFNTMLYEVSVEALRGGE
jgi:predicted component of type VI protein secretion system